MRTPFTRTAAGRAVLALVIGAAGGHAAAAGFQLNESSASGLGNAFAGGAALAEDASTLWSNPAGLTRLQGRQAVGVLHLITPSIKFSNRASQAASQQALGDNGGDAGGLNVVPNLYLALPLGPSLSAGIGVSAPWGLVSEYDDTFIGRFQATRSSIQTINVNPSLAWKAAPSLSLGFGLNVQRIDAEFNNRVNYSAALLSAAAANGIAPGSATFNALAQATPGLESQANVEGQDNATGWNAGLLWAPNPGLRLGLHYRSRISYHIAGDVRFTHPALPTIASPQLAGAAALLSRGVETNALFNTAVRADVKLPAIVNLSLFSSLGSQWDVMADLQWTEWSTIQNLRFERSNGSVLQDTPENFKDSWKIAVGTTYRPGAGWLVRAGVAWDKSPVSDAYRTPRLPDADKVWLSLGGQYLINSQFTLDAGLAYIIGRNADIDKSGDPASVAAYGRLNGDYRSRSSIVSAQLNYRF